MLVRVWFGASSPILLKTIFVFLIIIILLLLLIAIWFPRYGIVRSLIMSSLLHRDRCIHPSVADLALGDARVCFFQFVSEIEKGRWLICAWWCVG